MKPITVEDILGNPMASEWLKESVRALLKKDPMQAANEAEILAQAMRDYWLSFGRRDLPND